MRFSARDRHSLKPSQNLRLQFFPLTYALQPGETRQFIVDQKIADGSVIDVSSAASGTLYFVSNPDSPYFESETFNNIMQYIQKRANNARLKQVGKNFLLLVDKMRNMKDVESFLEGMFRN